VPCKQTHTHACAREHTNTHTHALTHTRAKALGVSIQCARTYGLGAAPLGREGELAPLLACVCILLAASAIKKQLLLPSGAENLPPPPPPSKRDTTPRAWTPPPPPTLPPAPSVPSPPPLPRGGCQKGHAFAWHLSPYRQAIVEGTCISVNVCTCVHGFNVLIHIYTYVSTYENAIVSV
jgi:hypothetical protein